MANHTTDNFFGRKNKDERVQKRLTRRADRKRRAAEKLDARQGITSEQRKKLQEVDLEKKKLEVESKKAEVRQDEAVANIANNMPTAPPKASNTWIWIVLLVLLLAAIALFFLL